MTYSSLSKRFPKHSYFCGWYYRCQSNKQTLAIIPSVHKTKNSAFCTIQVITDIKTVSGMLGHFSAGFTLDTYAHVTTSAQKEAAQTIGNILSL